MEDQHRPIETLRPVPPAVRIETTETVSPDENQTWWARYQSGISRLPEDTQRVLEDDARYIAERAFPTVSGVVDASAFGTHRVRTGIVVGSVQSGKTASMLAVAALLLDKGVDILVVLAGTRVALWLQTYERVLSQLDGSDVHTAWRRNRLRALVPQPDDVLAGDERADPFRYLRGARLKVKEAFKVGRPSIFVIPKEDDHLLALNRFLAEHFDKDACKQRSHPVGLVVLDDEADDASILDAREGSKITPQYIQHLWSSERSAPCTLHDRLMATYIAYTATPQANYLQRSHNPLAPRHFHAALRVPSDKGGLSPRTATYTERRGLKSYYIGGDFYYERWRGLNGDPCVAYAYPSPLSGDDDATALARYESVRWQMIGDALRSYFVAGAVRLHLQGKRLSRVPQAPVELEALQRELPAPHSMLYHPSALKEQHFAGAEDLVRWSLAAPGDETKAELPLDDLGRPRLRLDARGLACRLTKEESAWKAWLPQFLATYAALVSLPGGSNLPLSSVTWPDVRRILIDEIFPFVQLRVLNSDPRADDRAVFTPMQDGPTNAQWNAPRDIYTIFVAGNVLSRGLTVEGLCTSLFSRSAHEPAADTQMQMQRWFGYRGEYLPFCRVFLFKDQRDLFLRYHQNDVALKTEILSHMGGHSAPFGEGVLVLQGEAFRATGKVESQRVPLHPGATPSIRLVEPPSGALYEANVDLAQELLDQGDWQVLEFPAGIQRGLIRVTPLSLLEVASMLERLRYSTHDPDMSLEISQRWVSLQRMLNLPEPLFRPPGLRPGPMAVDPASCPYSIAAYLRLWAAALSRHELPGMQPTDNPSMPWHMLNLAAYRLTEPRFYLGVRFGSERNSTRLRWSGRGFSMMRRGLSGTRRDLLATLWGSRNPTERWMGDQVFDYHLHNPSASPRLLEDGAWRRRGQPGLVLLHPVIEPKSETEMIAFGLSLPHGGPDHVAALRTTD